MSAATPTMARSDLNYCDYFCWIGRQITLPRHTYEAQVDNKAAPASSWIWVWGHGVRVHADYYQEGDDQMHQIYASKSGANSKELAGKVIQFRVCGPTGIGSDVCGDWWRPKR